MKFTTISTIICISFSVCLAGPAPRGLSQTVVHERPVVFFLLFDDTASMGGRSSSPAAESWGVKIDEVRQQSSKFFESVPVGTELNLYSFSGALTRGGKILISRESEASDRNKAIDFLNRLNVKGERTRLWWALELVLDDAADYIERNPNAIVRVIAYTDGLDNDPHRKRPEDVLKKHEQLLRQKSVALTYVAIGYELGAEDKKLLQASNVDVRTAMKPAELIPIPMPSASFRVSSEKIEAGEKLTVVNESTGDRLTSFWRLGGSSTSRETHPSVCPQKTGDFELVLTVTDSLGRTSECRKSVAVVAKPVPAADFATVAPVVYIKQPIKCINRTSGTVDRFEWYVNDVERSTKRDLDIKATETGVQSIRLVAYSGTRSTSKTSQVEVLPLELPKVQVIGAGRTEFQNSVTLNCSIEQPENMASIERIDWYRDEVKLDTGKSLEASADSVCEFDFRCVVVTAAGNVEATHRLTVMPPPKPVVELALPPSVFVEDGIVIKPAISGNYDQVRYYIDETLQPEQGAEFSASFTDPGKHIFRVDAEGPGGISTAVAEVEVLPHPLPVAGFEFGTSRPRVGDEITLIDHSENAEVIEWFVGEDNKLLARRNYTNGDDPIVRYTPTSEAKTTVRQVVHSKGGTSEASQWISALPKLIAPQSTVRHRLLQTKHDGSQEFEFIVSAVGRVNSVAVDDGDGWQPIDLETNRFVKTWQPGRRNVKVQIIGLPDFNPEIHEFELQIPKPWPRWIVHLWWIAPLSIGFLVVSVFGFRRMSQLKFEHDSQMIVGTLRYRPTNDDFGDWDEIPFSGNKRKESFFLENGQAATLRSAFNTVDGSTTLLLMLGEGESSDTEVEIGNNEIVETGGHEFCFSRTA